MVVALGVSFVPLNPMSGSQRTFAQCEVPVPRFPRPGMRSHCRGQQEKADWIVNTRRLLLKCLLVAGVLLLVPAGTWLLGGFLGLLPTDLAAIAGYSGLRVIGSVAVAGCLLAAIGSADI